MSTNRFRSIEYSQVRIEPSEESNRSRERQALTKVSCTASSARCELPSALRASPVSSER